jgi:ubiquitin conjugation factor E4 B
MYNTIMKNPVILPSSKVIIDKASIERILLNGQFDPYTKAPLTKDMVIIFFI